MSRGKFIVIEGTDMVGKTTQCRLLCDQMMRLQIPVYRTCEPSTGPIGKMIRQEYLSGKRVVDRRSIDYLYIADRLDHVTNIEDGLLKQLSEGLNVVSDRFYMSSMAFYPLEFFGTDVYEDKMNEILEMHRPVWEQLTPDLTIVIDCPYEKAVQRLEKRPGKIEIYDNEDIIKKTAYGYKLAMDMLKKRGENIIKIDGTQSIEVVHNNIFNEVYKVI